MNKNNIIFLLVGLLTISVYNNYSNLMKDKQDIEAYIKSYTGYVTHTESFERSLKGNSPSYYYLEFVGKSFAIAEIIQRHPYYRYKDIYTDVPYDMRLLFNRAYNSNNREIEMIRLLEIRKIIAKHLSEEIVREPNDFYYAYISAQSEIREKNLLDDETMGGLLGW